MNTETSPSLKAVLDGENTRWLPFGISEALVKVLDDQREKLSAVDPKAPGRERYEQARQAGCPAAVAKGAKDRQLQRDRIYLPGTELSRRDGTVRISALKLTIPGIPPDVRVKGITFLHENEVWTGKLEVVETEGK